jgi:ribosome-associated protein
VVGSWPVRLHFRLEFQGFPLSEHDSQAASSAPLENSPSGPAGSRNNPEQGMVLALAAAKVCFDNFARDVTVLDMTQKTALFDYFVIATGTSRRHLHALSEEIDHVLEKDLNDKRISREGYDESRWIVLDYGNVVVHLFDEETRQYYGLEVLHSDAPKIDVAHLAPKTGPGPAEA